jgi:aspartyl protease family protein
MCRAAASYAAYAPPTSLFSCGKHASSADYLLGELTIAGHGELVLAWYDCAMPRGRFIRNFLVLTAAVSGAGVARAHLSTVLDNFVPVADTPAGAAVGRKGEGTKALVHKVRRNADGLFYVRALVNGKSMRFLVDTGASVVVLTESDARAVGLAIDDRGFSSKVKTVGGSAAMAWVTIDHLSLAGHEVHNLRAAVVKRGPGVSLLGQNMLSKLDTLTISENDLTLR